MSATIIINRLNGPYGTPTDVTGTNIRVDLSDAPHTNETSDPVIIPSPSNTHYSYWCVLQLECTVAPVTLVDNLRLYFDGTNSLGTGISLLGGKASGYTMATGGSSSGLQLTSGNYPTVSYGPYDVFSNFTSGSPLTITGSTSTTGAFGEYFVMQYSIDSSAGSGAAAAQEPIVIQYDEN